MQTVNYNDVVLAKLLITNQPFPSTIKQHTTVSDAVEVRLLTAARSRVDGPNLPVKAELICDWTVANKKQSNPIKGGEEKFNKERLAVFDKLKFIVGSACKPVTMKFNLSMNSKKEYLQFRK